MERQGMELCGFAVMNEEEIMIVNGGSGKIDVTTDTGVQTTVGPVTVATSTQTGVTTITVALPIPVSPYSTITITPKPSVAPGKLSGDGSQSDCGVHNGLYHGSSSTSGSSNTGSLGGGSSTGGGK